MNSQRTATFQYFRVPMWLKIISIGLVLLFIVLVSRPIVFDMLNLVVQNQMGDAVVTDAAGNPLNPQLWLAAQATTIVGVEADGLAITSTCGPAGGSITFKFQDQLFDFKTSEKRCWWGGHITNFEKALEILSGKGQIELPDWLKTFLNRPNVMIELTKMLGRVKAAELAAEIARIFGGE